MKKIFSFLLLLIGVLFLSGCSVDNSQSIVDKWDSNYFSPSELSIKIKENILPVYNSVQTFLFTQNKTDKQNALSCIDTAIRNLQDLKSTIRKENEVIKILQKLKTAVEKEQKNTIQQYLKSLSRY